MKIEFISNNIIMNIGIFISFFVFILIFTIFVIFIISLFKERKFKNFQPKISIIIPMYNEEENIEKCVSSILKSNYDLKKTEILCVDDGSTDNTKNIIESLSKNNKIIKLISGKHNGKSDAVNLGIKHTKHDYIIMIDADTIIHKNFIKEIIRPFSDKKVGATNGVGFINNPKTIAERFQDVEYQYNDLIRTSFSKVFGNGIWFFGAAACYRKDILKKVGNFKKDILTEDFDMSLKIFRLDLDVLVVENARYYTAPMKNLKELFIQRSRWFFGGIQCVFKHFNLIKKKSFAIKYLFFNQIFWTIFSVINIPMITYQVFYWLPNIKSEIIPYLFRWFSIFGPIYVLYKIPEWGISFLSLFGISSGIFTTILILLSINKFKEKLNISRILVLIFYFPYTIVLNFILVLSLIKYSKSKNKYFLK
ncbi:glycosyltransferase family 2 protein [archaeon]|jgi:cellulose synthase/poly-beta-1,6-N-acetylglucosamine synthase-like glycosyltransferase|nr:glycosyltransferase family 2 protein [archaeon]